MSCALPFGDPCPRCGAASTLADVRDRVCDCVPCEVCEYLTGNTCAYCRRSLGCRWHGVGIEEHIATYCLADAETRAEMDAIIEAHGKDDGWDTVREMAIELRHSTPKPWPAPVMHVAPRTATE